MIQRRSSFLVLLAVAALVLATLFAGAAPAQAQDADPDNDALPYPGPFGDPADDAASSSSDEVLSETVTAGDDEHDADRSIDYIGDDAGSYFERPSPIPSSDPAAAGGTGGGLAVTGSEVEPIVAISVGLLAVGGSVLVSSRRRIRDFFA